MGEMGRGSWRRTFNRHVGLGTTILGLAIILASFQFLDNIVAWYTTIMVGLFVVLGGFLYAAYPVLTSERRDFALRREVEHFVGLVRTLNETNAASRSEEELGRIKADMAASVERLARITGKEGEAG